DLKVRQIRDYQQQTITDRAGNTTPLAGPTGDLVILDFQADGNYVAIRPSGTEPKIKFYSFVWHPPQDGADLAAVKTMLENRLLALEHDLKQFAGT
nr:phospho-sugar mutase [Planctomycetales bacterium]NIM08974.1 phospho-sugar mutase [Planctomycetales bacterium]NIN08437.1 phospho-sugar mutase [Planctomycetales bacterium]NIN77566.1 phospho-sugar mutase [Planctomycetales bacterium]NIO34736.1 phospho-sugar mutase [Planctomycetales bacterium]